MIATSRQTSIFVNTDAANFYLKSIHIFRPSASTRLTMSGVPFVCQRCKQPLRIHESLTDLSPAAFDLLAGTHRTQTPPAPHDTNAQRPSQQSPRASTHIPADRRHVYEKTLKGQEPQQQTPIVKRVIPTVKNSSPTTGTKVPTGPRSNESFVVLTQSQIQKSPPKQDGVPNGTTSGSGENGVDRRRISAKLFDAISGRSDIDYPMCTECADILLETMSAKHAQVKRERDGYLDYIKGLQSEGQVTPDEVAAAEKELDEVLPTITWTNVEIRRQETAAMEELKAAEAELSNLQSEIARLESESVALNAEEAAFWRSRNAFSLSLEEFQNERDEVNIKYDHDAKLLERLQRTNVYNDAFCITHDGFFGVINGLRLGRLPNKQVKILFVVLGLMG
jgi:beclin